MCIYLILNFEQISFQTFDSIIFLKKRFLNFYRKIYSKICASKFIIKNSDAIFNMTFWHIKLNQTKPISHSHPLNLKPC